MAESSVPTEKPLTAKQRRFIDEYLVDLRALPAAERAGFSVRDKGVGSRLLYQPHIYAEIRRRLLARRVRLEATGDHIRYGFAAIAWDPREEAEGGPSFTERIAALRELGRLHGLYIEKHVFTGATLEQLLAMADEKAKTLPAPAPPERLKLIQGGRT
ncbi:MAG TPA: terminase small subunit [Candidatus Sulfotelmatobacter sp.]|nr:terminase small subunit [Candidatus Sulfotelmatobacter sp.]